MGDTRFVGGHALRLARRGEGGVADAVGLILPYTLRILPGITALAATGLVVIMVGATVSTLAIGGGLLALPTLVLGLLAALVAYGRRPQAPYISMTRSVLQPAL